MRQLHLPFRAVICLLAVVMYPTEASDVCGRNFFSALVQMIPCRSAVAPFSPLPPTEACCQAIIALGQPCLCALINGPPVSGVDRNMTLQLPDKCLANFEPCAMG
uniref:Bifunctional inhibitor/plant lipid transfer protein/seed storage helical domain-containing protein n=1 Tax=Kalanchoe fedtschenkoi TaxID=63787 RepID=A0A7N0V2W9_KALFE